jgi:hypothetical protein
VAQQCYASPQRQRCSVLHSMIPWQRQDALRPDSQLRLLLHGMLPCLRTSCAGTCHLLYAATGVTVICKPALAGCERTTCAAAISKEAASEPAAGGQDGSPSRCVLVDWHLFCFCINMCAHRHALLCESKPCYCQLTMIKCSVWHKHARQHAHTITHINCSRC